MKLSSYLTLCVPAIISITASAAGAESYTQTTTVESAPGVSVETREGVIETAPTTVIREQPTTIIEERPVVTQPIIEREKIVEKRPSHHLIKVGPVKVF